MTTEKKHKKGFRCERAEKSVNYQRKAKILLCFRFKLKQRDQLPTAENCFQFEKRSGHCNQDENSVIWQRNRKNVLFSEIEPTSVNLPKKGQESSSCSKKVKTG